MRTMGLHGSSLALAMALVAGCHSPTSTGPVLEVDRTSHEFPRSQTGELQTEFALQNSGNQLLEILDIETSCGCAVAVSPEKRLAPGQTTRMSVRLNRPAAGERTVKLTVVTNSPHTPRVELQLVCRATSDDSRIVQVTPQRVIFPHVSRAGSRQELTCTTFEKRHDRLIETLKCDLSFIDVRLAGMDETPATVPGYVRRNYRFDVRVRDDPPLGRFLGFLTLSSTKTATPQLHRPVALELSLKADVWAEPEILLGNLTSEGNLPSWRIAVWSRSPQVDYQITGVEVEADWLEVQLSDQTSGRNQADRKAAPPMAMTVRVVSVPNQMPGRAVIWIHTTHPTSPKIELPVLLLASNEGLN